MDALGTLVLASLCTIAILWSSVTSLGSPVGRGDALSHYATGLLGPAGTHFGYPFGMRPFAYFPATDLTQRGLATLLNAITGQRVLSVNLVWVLSFPLTSISAWWVLRLVRAPRLLAVPLAVSFCFIPYHILRGLEHIYLAAIWSVPVAVGVALLVGRGQIPGMITGTLRSKSVLIVLCVVIAWSGIYYAFFACLLMFTALIWLFAQGASRRTLAHSAFPLVAVVGAVAAVLGAAAMVNLSDPPTSLVASRQPSESARYAGNLSFAVTPSPLSDVPVLGNAAGRFDAYVQPETEGSSYGQFGTVVTTLSALIFVVGVALSRRHRRNPPSASLAADRDRSLLLAMLGTCLMFFVPWGLNFTFALLVTPEIRAWDRLLPLILLLLMLGAVVVVRGWVSADRPMRDILAAVVILVLTLLDGVTPYRGLLAAHFHSGDREMRSATRYAAAVNLAVPQRCGVLQLPYVPFPEMAQKIGRMKDYEHFLVALGNPRKQWSYGGVKFTTASRWASRLSDDLTASSIKSLTEGGFCGIHLDRVGYSRSEAAMVSALLEDLLGPPVAVGRGDRWQFFKLPPGSSTPVDVRDRASLTRQTADLFYPPETSRP